MVLNPFSFLACAVAIGLFFIIISNLKSPGKRVEHKIDALGDLRSPEIMRSIGQLLGPPLVDGNKIIPHHNGDEIFPAMLNAIKNAKATITFETFIYWSGEIGQMFADALSEQAKRGIKVHVLLDWVGSNKCDITALKELKDAGVTVERYRPLRWYNLGRINNRTHRKILVVDGMIGFTGGVGIADLWRGRASNPDQWRDSHFEIRGPVVAQLQAAFADNWNATNPTVLHGNDYFPPIEKAGDTVAQVFKSSPEEGSGSVRLMYLYSIAHAKNTILIANAYFVPDSHVRKFLIDAKNRGVKIEVIVPGKNIDTVVTRRASRAVWGPMLEAGVKIFEYQPTMFHCKYMVIDGVWSSVGSTNLDNRSFRLNDECNLNVIDKDFGAVLEAMFEKDKLSSREITFQQWQNRPLLGKIIEKCASLVSSQV